MNIQDATKQAMAEQAFMTRRSWEGRIHILPTHKRSRCKQFIKGKVPGRSFSPQAADLIADDWEVTKVGLTY